MPEELSHGSAAAGEGDASPAPESPGSSRYPARLFSSLEAAPNDGLPPGAGPGRRLAARLIDTAVRFLASGVGGIAAGLVLGVAVGLSGGDPQATFGRLQADGSPGLAGWVLALAAGVVFHALCEGIHGSTPGKRMLGLVVIGQDGGEASLLGALKRSVAFYWDGLFFGAPALVSMRDSPKQQRYGDKWGKTMVVRLADLPPERRPSIGRFLGVTALALAFEGVIGSTIALLPLL